MNKKKIYKKRAKGLKKGSKNEFLSLNAARMKREPTDAENIFKKILEEKGITYDEQVPFMRDGHKYIFDFIVVKRWVVEIDGGYHNTAEQQDKDKKRDEYLKSIGYKVRRFTNYEVMNYSKNLHKWLNGIYGAYHIKEKTKSNERNSYNVQKAKIEMYKLDDEFKK